MPESTKELSGRELSAFVAEHLFGEPMPPIPKECPFDINHAEPSPEGHWQHVHTYENGDACEWEPYPYGEEIEAAMQVVEKMATKGALCTIKNALDGDEFVWIVEFEIRNLKNMFISRTLPSAVCSAAVQCLDLS